MIQKSMLKKFQTDVVANSWSLGMTRIGSIAKANEKGVRQFELRDVEALINPTLTESKKDIKYQLNVNKEKLPEVPAKWKSALSKQKNKQGDASAKKVFKSVLESYTWKEKDKDSKDKLTEQLKEKFLNEIEDSYPVYIFRPDG